MNDNFCFVKVDNNKNGHLYNIFENDAQENQIGLLKMRYGILYLFPVINTEVIWGEELGAWVFDDINKRDLNEEEKINIFAKCIDEIKDYFEI